MYGSNLNITRWPDKCRQNNLSHNLITASYLLMKNTIKTLWNNTHMYLNGDPWNCSRVYVSKPFYQRNRYV